MELHFTINIYLYRCNLTNKSIIFSLHNTQGRFNSRFPHVTKECEKKPPKGFSCSYMVTNQKTMAKRCPHCFLGALVMGHDSVKCT